MSLNSKLELQALIRRIENLISMKRYDDARSGLQQILKMRKNDARALWLLIALNWADNQRDESIRLLRRYCKLYPRELKAPILLGDYLARKGRSQEAQSILKRLLRKHPDHPNVLYAMADVLELRGEKDKAIEILKPLVEAGPTHPDTVLLYVDLLIQQKDEQNAVDVAQRQLENPNLQPTKQKKLWFLLGKAYEKLDQSEQAFHAYTKANRFDEGNFNETQAMQVIERMMAVFTPEALSGFPRSTLNSEVPVFVVSRPRSGSTLVERIIGSHSTAHAAGELEFFFENLYQLDMRLHSTLPFPECVADLEPDDADELARDYLEVIEKLEHGVLRVTDKSIGNAPLLGVIALLFPRAKIIDVRRNPIDTCLAGFTVDLSHNFPGSSRLEDLALEYKLHIRIMEHWHQVLDIPILRVNYEDLVADQETWSRRLIDFVGLPWEDQCLRFYETGKKHKQQMTAAPTLSHAQVTQPIYTSSVNRSVRFAAYLDPVRQALGLDQSASPLGHDLRF